VPKHEHEIVVVDDDASVSQAIMRVLSAAGLHAVTFSSAEALLQAGAAKSADCLILDIVLPGLSGFELHQRLAEAGRKTPVIFITAHDEPAGRERARQAGAIAYLIKPFSGRALVAVVAEVLDQD
jgi:FixJ family two-component response regulator